MRILDTFLQGYGIQEDETVLTQMCTRIGQMLYDNYEYVIADVNPLLVPCVSSAKMLGELSVCHDDSETLQSVKIQHTEYVDGIQQGDFEHSSMDQKWDSSQQDTTRPILGDFLGVYR